MKKILVIDDDEDFRELIKSQLEISGYEVVTASDGMGGVVMAQEQKPQLVIVDIMMPNLDGRSLIRQFQEDDATKAIPIIIMSGTGEDKELAKNKNIVYQFVKPFDTDLFTRMVNEVMTGDIKYE